MDGHGNKIYLKIIFALISVIFLASISLSIGDRTQPVSIFVMPEVPKEDQPLFITFDLNNPSEEDDLVNYEFYANGKLLMQGKEFLSPSSTKQHSYVYPDSPKIGERITFLVKTESARGSYDKILSIPAYAPQVWSSFVSFASFSTSLMSSSMSTSIITSEPFYANSFTNNSKLNVGLIFSIVLILLLIYLELTEHLKDKTLTLIGGLRIRFSKLSAILFIVFMGMVFTKVAMII